MSHESTHIMEQIWENPLFWLSYPQPQPKFTDYLPTQKALQNAKKVESEGRFHPEPTDAGRQVSPPAAGHKTLVSVGEPQVSGPSRT
jgi:hypothetical protein